jgi:hypothetical protein
VRRLALPLALSLVALVASAADAPEPEPARGPASIRDGHVLAQGRLTLPAVSPEPTRTGRWQLEVGLLWSNSFSWVQDVPGETPADRRFLLDGETMTVDLTVRRGLARDLDVGLRLAAQGRNGGVLDAFIDAWHRLTNAPDAHRPDFLRDAFRVEGQTTAGAPFSWNASQGWGAGGLELETRWRFVDGAGRSPSAALVGRLVLPTGSGPYSEDGLGAGGQLVLDAPLGRSVNLYAGLGGTAQDPGPVRALEYSTTRVEGFVALEWRVARTLSLLGETNAASRLVRNIDAFPGTHWTASLGGRLDLGERTRLDVFLVENLYSQLTTADFALRFAVSVRP